jgi:hypothetical protein
LSKPQARPLNELLPLRIGQGRFAQKAKRLFNARRDMNTDVWSSSGWLTMATVSLSTSKTELSLVGG